MKRIITLTWMLVLVLATQSQSELPEPIPNSFVHDFAGVIDDGKEAEIQEHAKRLKDELKTEIALVTIDSLNGQDSFDYSLRMARAWGIGSKDNEIRGLLILVAVKDRKTSFRTSRHIEGELPDGVTGDISREMNGYFKKGDFGGGFSVALDRVIERLSATDDAQSTASTTGESSFNPAWLLLIPAGFIGIGSIPIILILRARRKGRNGPQRLASSLKQKRRRKQAATRKQKPAMKKKAARNKPGSHSESSYSSGTSSSYDSGTSSSTSSDTGSSYSGGSDFGGGGSDTSW